MSFSFDYYFKSDKTLVELATQINEVVGCSLRPSAGLPETAYTAFPFFGMELGLSIYPISAEEAYADDGEIEFSAYNYELDITTYSGQGDARPTQLPVIISAIYILHRRLGITGMMVFNLEQLLARYEERVNEKGRPELYDIVSGTLFTTFADHLNLVQLQLPEQWREAYVTRL